MPVSSGKRLNTSVVFNVKAASCSRFLRCKTPRLVLLQNHNVLAPADKSRVSDQASPMNPVSAMKARRDPTVTQLRPGRAVCALSATVALTIFLAIGVNSSVAADGEENHPEPRELLRTGRYGECAALCDARLAAKDLSESNLLLKIDSELALGDYAAARQTAARGMLQHPWSIPLKRQGIITSRMVGDHARAAAFLQEIQDSVARTPWRYGEPPNLVAVGRTAIEVGADPRKVMENLFDRALRADPDLLDGYLAIGDLALSKGDHPLAAETFRAARERFSDEPAVLVGLARALWQDDRQGAEDALEKALAVNPAFVPARLLLVEQFIDAERYDAAAEELQRIFEVNPREPRACSYQSLLSELAADPKGASLWRAAALSTWPQNPEVDYLLGRKLSQKYRFAEGAAAQRRALALDARFHAAAIQLGQDLLRLGENAEAWQLIDAAHKAEGYHVESFNLLQLKDTLDRYVTLESPHFLVRMDRREAVIYGADVLDLLHRAREQLGQRYGYRPSGQITVEIFVEPDDFAVRTFGLPGAEGYLGVCFGRVITSNSPQSMARLSQNWQSVLWHEYCHVVTLQRTRHRIPRWLSEGLSVYEERQAAPTWGQRLNSEWRDWILTGRMSSLEELSGAFLRPPSPQHLQFAYFQASLVVQFLIERYGEAKLSGILDDIALGLPIQDALERRTNPVGQLNAEFFEYARELARNLGSGLDWQQYDLSAIATSDDPQAITGWINDHPLSLTGLKLGTQILLSRRDWGAAEPLLQRWIRAFPEAREDRPNPSELLADLYAVTKRPDDECEVLWDALQFVELSSSRLQRLRERLVERQQWERLAVVCERGLALNPMDLSLQRHREQAAAERSRWAEAIRAADAQLELDPPDRPRVLYRLATYCRHVGDPRARSLLLDALELAPRFEAAYELLEEVDALNEPVGLAE